MWRPHSPPPPGMPAHLDQDCERLLSSIAPLYVATWAALPLGIIPSIVQGREGGRELLREALNSERTWPGPNPLLQRLQALLPSPPPTTPRPAPPPTTTTPLSAGFAQTSGSLSLIFLPDHPLQYPNLTSGFFESTSPSPLPSGDAGSAPAEVPLPSPTPLRPSHSQEASDTAPEPGEQRQKS